MARIAYEQNLKVKKRSDQKPGVCRLIHNGEPCKGKTHARGLCTKHQSYCLRWDLIDKYAAKPKFSYVATTQYSIKTKVKAGQCHLKENGKPCTRPIHGRGLCSRHYLTLDRHGLLVKYGTTSRKDPRTFSVKKIRTDGICRILENKKGCQRESASRGLCAKHYLRFLRDGRIKKFSQ